MDASTYARVKDIYFEALDLTPRERVAFLGRACAGDAALRAEVEALLANTEDEALIEDAPPDDDPLGVLDTTLDGGWQVERWVAHGGFSHVYRGRHRAEGFPVALKFLQPSPTADHAVFRETFTREAGVLRTLAEAQAAVVQTHGLVEYRTRRGKSGLCLVLEWLDGQVLADALAEQRRRWSVDEVIEVLAPVAEALATAHRNGIAHRDIKPDNIFLVERDGARTSRLFDFGVAKVAALHSRGFESTASAFSAFTVAYAAPEQLARKRYGTSGPRSDVYALALVCAELLGGRRVGDSDVQSMMARTLDPQRRPVPAGLSPPVTECLRVALAVDPGERPADAGAFWSALRRAAAGQPPYAPSRKRWLDRLLRR